MRARSGTVVTRVALVLLGLLGGRGASAGVVEHDTTRSGDRVLGDVLAPRDVDVYDFEAPRGAAVVLSAKPAAPGRWQARQIGVIDAAYSRFVNTVGTGPTTVRTEPLNASGTWRLVVGTTEARLGAYDVRLTVAPARKFSTGGTGAATPPPLVIGAPAGSVLTVTLRWNGRAPVKLDPAAGISGPNGTVLTSASVPRSTRSSSTQSGFRTTALGDHSVRFAVPAGTKSWRADISVRPPRPGPRRTRDLRTVGAPKSHTVQLVDAHDFIAIRVAGEQGGPNDLLVAPTNPQPGQGGVDPVAFAVDGRGFSCAAFRLDLGSPPGAYRFVCTGGATTDLRDVVRSGDRVVAFDAPDVRSPAGTGRVAVSGVVYDTALRAVAWTEIRTFDASGRVHVLEVSGVERRPDGAVIGYTVVHSGPGGTGGTYEYALLQTR